VTKKGENGSLDATSAPEGQVRRLDWPGGGREKEELCREMGQRRVGGVDQLGNRMEHVANPRSQPSGIAAQERLGPRCDLDDRILGGSESR
jgi:hypothetical protein